MQILYTDIYLLHVSTVYFSLHRVGIMVHKKKYKGEKPLLKNSGDNIIVQNMCDVTGVGQIWGRHDCQTVVYNESQMCFPWFHTNLLAPASAQRRGLVSETNPLNSRVRDLWLFPQVVSPTATEVPSRTTHLASHSKSAPTGHLQSDVLVADPHLRCLQAGEQPPPSRIDITGRNLATSLTHISCPYAAGDLMDGARKLCSRPVLLLQTVTKCQPSGTLTCLQIMSSSKEAQQTYIFTVLSTWNPLNTSEQNVP